VENMRNTFYCYYRSVFLTSIALSIIGCATVKVPLEISYPSDIEPAKYKVVIFGDVNGNAGQELMLQVRERLSNGFCVTGHCSSKGSYEVIDRIGLDALLKELNLDYTDLNDVNYMKKLTDLTPPAIIVIGSYNLVYTENISSSSRGCAEEDRTPACLQNKMRPNIISDGEVTVVDTSTGEMLINRKLGHKCDDAKARPTAFPTPALETKLSNQCIAEDAMVLASMLQPHKSSATVKFKKSGDVPLLAKGISEIKEGNFDAAKITFSDAIVNVESNPQLKAKIKAYAYWDLGFAYEYTHEFDKSLESFERAGKIDPSGVHIEEIAHVEIYKKEKELLDERFKNK
jgi:tetratricopeptide (TPR) repeat protein